MTERERYERAHAERRAHDTAAMLRSSVGLMLTRCSVCNGLLPDVQNLHMCKDWEPVPVADAPSLKGGQGRSPHDVEQDGAAMAVGCVVLVLLVFWYGVWLFWHGGMS